MRQSRQGLLLNLLLKIGLAPFCFLGQLAPTKALHIYSSTTAVGSSKCTAYSLYNVFF